MNQRRNKPQHPQPLGIFQSLELGVSCRSTRPDSLALALSSDEQFSRNLRILALRKLRSPLERMKQVVKVHSSTLTEIHLDSLVCSFTASELLHVVRKTTDMTRLTIQLCEPARFPFLFCREIAAETPSGFQREFNVVLAVERI